MIDAGAAGVAVVASGGGLAVHRVASMIAQADFEGITPLVDGGATVFAFGALLYLVRQLVSGRLVASDTSRREEQLTQAVHELTEMVKQSHIREERVMTLLTQRLNPGDPT